MVVEHLNASFRAVLGVFELNPESVHLPLQMSVFRGGSLVVVVVAIGVGVVIAILVVVVVVVVAVLVVWSRKAMSMGTLNAFDTQGWPWR